MGNKFEIHRYRRNADGTVVVSEEQLRNLENTAKELDEKFKKQRSQTRAAYGVIQSQNGGELRTDRR